MPFEYPLEGALLYIIPGGHRSAFSCTKRCNIFLYFQLSFLKALEKVSKITFILIAKLKSILQEDNDSVRYITDSIIEVKAISEFTDQMQVTDEEGLIKVKELKDLCKHTSKILWESINVGTYNYLEDLKQ